jgi:hypothetical protein
MTQPPLNSSCFSAPYAAGRCIAHLRDRFRQSLRSMLLSQHGSSKCNVCFAPEAAAIHKALKASAKGKCRSARLDAVRLRIFYTAIRANDRQVRSHRIKS